jgi:cell shape-determining protein MreC
MQALFGIMLTLIVCAVLGSSSMMLSKNTNDLVISPIEEMVKKVYRIAENPLKAAQDNENEEMAIEEFEAELKNKN